MVQQFQIKLSPSNWVKAREARLETGRLWTRMVKVHRRCRKYHQPWPTQSKYEKHYKGKFDLHSQTVQAIIGKFFSNIETTKTNRKNGLKASYPWRERKYYNPVWKGQSVRLKGKNLTLPMGKGRSPLKIKLPHAVTGRVVQVELGFNTVYLTLSAEIPVQPRLFSRPGAGDLGVCNLIALTDGEETLIISGRGLRSIQQGRAKGIAALDTQIAKCKKGSRRRKKLVKAKWSLRRKADAQVRNLLHHAANQAVAFAVKKELTHVTTGDLGDINRGTKGKKKKQNNQDVGNWPHGQYTRYLNYKLQQVGIGHAKQSEAYTSQTCPACGHKHKPKGRMFRCPKCKFTALRDEVGAYNQPNKTIDNNIIPGRCIPTGKVKYLRPVRLKRVVPRAVDAADTGPTKTIVAVSRSLGLANGSTVYQKAFALATVAVASD